MLVRVRHINVVMVHGADVQGGRLGFWMDFIEGSTLHDVIHREGNRSAGEALAWGQDLCRALAAVHNAGIVHRDVKAQNVMRRTSDGRLILMDFGAGEILGASRTRAGSRNTALSRAGTPERRRSVPKLGHLRAGRPAVLSRVSQISGARQHLGRARGRARAARARAAGRPAARHAADLHGRDRASPQARALAAIRERRRDAGGHARRRRFRAADATTIAAAGARSHQRAPSPLRQTAVQHRVIAAGLFGLTLVLGYVACVAFEASLRIDPFLQLRILRLRHGWPRRRACPFLVNWMAASALVLPCFGGGRQASWRLLESVCSG